MDSPPDQRENNVTATGTTGRFAGASLLPVPVMAAPIVLEKVYMKLKLGAFRVQGSFCKTEEFRVNLPTSSSKHGDNLQRNNMNATLESGSSFQVLGKSIYCTPYKCSY